MLNFKKKEFLQIRKLNVLSINLNIRRKDNYLQKYAIQVSHAKPGVGVLWKLPLYFLHTQHGNIYYLRIH
jgi:hypothetical protein